MRGYVEALGLGNLFDAPMLRLLHQFHEATTLGSLIQPCMDEQQIAFARGFIELKDLGSHLFLSETHRKVLRALEQAEDLARRYHVVVANPPYLGGRQLNAKLKEFAARHFQDSKADLFSMFIERGFSLVFPHARLAMVTMESWMFISSFESLRSKLLRNSIFQSMVHMPYLGRGGTSMGINFGTAATVWINKPPAGDRGYFQCVRYFECDDAGTPFTFPVENERASWQTSETFINIPGRPIAYWIGPSTARAFRERNTFGEFGETRLGMATADNDQFIRRWYEVDRSNFATTCLSRQEAEESRCRWFPYAKGGDYRKWFGNCEFLVDWEQDGRRIRTFTDQDGKVRSHNYNLDFIFRPGITWSALSSSDTSMRLLECSLFDNAGSSCFPPFALRESVLGFLNSKLLKHFIEFISPTLNYQPGDIGKVPVDLGILADIRLEEHSATCVSIARSDWNNFEYSWDFREAPLLRTGVKSSTVEASWGIWQAQGNAAIKNMQALETEINSILIAAYGVETELTPEASEEQITLARPEVRRDMVAFLSYAVGCMLGRYSLDHPGLILANAGESAPEYLAKIGVDQDKLTFAPDEDGIIPVLDGEWFEDDIVARSREFLRATFGEATLRENIRFIEESLGRDLRSYFLTDFYKDHLQTYKKRPIYWMIQSPGKGFSVLIYLHRYTRDTMNLVLNRYLREFQIKLRSRIAHLAEVQTSGAMSTRDKTVARKEFDKLTKALHECEEWERQVVLPLAQARIELDLDDGVKVNYLKLREALAPIPGLAAAED